MSYNISSWKTKKIENLVIPIDAFFMHERTDWHPSKPEVINQETNEVILECGIEQGIIGILKDGNLTVTELNMTGEGSGTFFNWILEPALQKSTGFLEAVLIWEDGDYIEKLLVSSGEISKEEIEL